MDSNTQLKKQFTWIPFYMEFADKLLPFKNNRSQLLELIKDVYDNLGLHYPFTEKDGTPFDDICPFTVFGCFNKGISNENRIALMKGIGSKLGVTAEIPTEFDGIPVLNNMKAWFFGGRDLRKEDDITNLWNVFEAGINYADNPSEVSESSFIEFYDKARKQFGIRWNLTVGLYWIRPFSYLNLDERNRNYLTQNNSPYYESIAKISGLKQPPSAKTYLEIISACKKIFAKSENPHKSFPELSHAAWIITTSTGVNKPGWIFQGNPKYYDIFNAINDLDVITWSVKQYQNQIKKGDRAYIWVSGPEGGIAASGIIKCDPEIRENGDPDPYDIFGKVNTDEVPVVDIELTNKLTDSIIKKEDLLKDERLKNINIFSFYNATNYKLTVEQADTIDSIINGTYIPVEAKERGKSILSSSKRYWIYAPGHNSSKWEEFYSLGIMGIGWEEIGDLKQYPSKNAIKTKMKEVYGAEYSYVNSALATWQFANEIKVGDIVYAKKGMYKIIGRGIVESDYIYDPGRSEYNNTRKIKWTHKGEWDHPGQAVMKTLTDITPYTDYVQKLEALFADDNSIEDNEEQEIPAESYTEDNFLSEVFMDAGRYNTLVNLLKNKKNIILQGAPGVGKTFAAKRLAFSMMGQKDSSRVMMVQFHQSYSYEDFIMGFRPSKDGFELTPGPFYQFCKKAQDDDERDYFFIIDEINRGNVSKIFGELMMLIEKEKRGEELRLLYSNELFSVPENVYIIGMMNTADRSLAIIDYALRRRFAFFELEPAFDSDGFRAYMQKANNPKFNALVEQIMALNDFICKDESLGSGFQIGHSYLCTDGEITDEWLESVIKYEIIPLLNEYWFDEPSKIEQWSKRLRDVLND